LTGNVADATVKCTALLTAKSVELLDVGVVVGDLCRSEPESTQQCSSCS